MIVVIKNMTLRLTSSVLPADIVIALEIRMRVFIRRILIIVIIVVINSHASEELSWFRVKV